MAESAEVTPFRITGYDGKAYVRYFQDEFISYSSGEEIDQREGSTLEQGFDVTLHSYFYHPNFFRLDFGGGPVFVQHRYDSRTLNSSGSTQAFNYHTKAHILEKKPYPLMLYYDRHYSTSPYAVQDRMFLDHETYGFNFKLRRPFTPVAVELDVSHSSVDGELDRDDSFRLETNDTTKRASLKLSSELGPNGDGSIIFSRTDKTTGDLSTLNGVTSERDSQRTTDQINARTHHKFGRDDWIRFDNSLLYRDQDNLPEREEFRYTPRVRLIHSKTLKSHYRYSYLDKTVEGIDTTAHQFNAGVSHRAFEDKLSSNLDFRTDTYDTEGLEQKYYQAEANLSYLQALNPFQLRYSGGWIYDYTDRTSDNSLVPIRAETHSIENQFDSFELENENVIATSIEVYNALGNQCVEGTHYQIVTVADTTEIEWLAELDDADCSLMPDNQVLVNYTYDAGGTATFTGLRQYYGIDLSKGRLLRLYARYGRVDRDLESGDPTIPINSESTFTTGIESDHSFSKIITLGGQAEYQQHDEEISAYRRLSWGGYAQLSKYIYGNLRLFADWIKQDNQDTPEDVDLTRYGLRYQSRVWYRTRFTLDYVEETDSGGRQERTATRAKARLNWDYRKLSLAAEARYRLVGLGDSESEHSSINLILTRRF